MKSLKNYIKGLALVPVIAFCMTSCQDQPDAFRQADGVPVLHYVRYADRDVVITEAYMAETVCLVGDNLRSINQLWFNDQKAILNTSYMTDHTLLVSVPKEMAVEETDKIYMITAQKDTVKYDFKVFPPVPQVKEMSFEYAKAGERVTIYGDYFYQKEGGVPLTVEFPNAIVTDIPDSDITFSSVTVTVPDEALPGKIKVTTASGTGASDFMFRDDRGLLFDFDGTNGLYTTNKGWHEVPLAEGGVSGKCMMLDASGEEFKCDGSDWHDGTCHFEYWAGNWKDPEDYGDWDGRRLFDIVDFTNFRSMVLKFEVKIDPEHAWTGCPMQIIFSGVQHVSNGNKVKDIYGNTLAGCNNEYFHNDEISLPRYLWRPWAKTGSYDTNGEWRTVTVPISGFNQYSDGTPAAGNLSVDCFANLELFFYAGTESEGTPCSPIVYVDNIRAVPVR